MKSVFVVRHGNTFAGDDPPHRIGCRTDLPLTDEGCAQASALGRWFAAQGIAFTDALCGPLQRTTATARRIMAAQDGVVEATPTPMLNEVDHGIDEGQPESVVEARHGREALRRWDEEGVPAAGWSVDRDGRLAWWRSLFARPPGACTLIVTSNGAARFALLALDGQALPRSLKLRTGAFGRLRQSGDGEPFRLLEWDVRPMPPRD